MKSRQKKNQEKEKSVLIDITNGSPIVGLAMGSLMTPSSRCMKKQMVVSNSESKNIVDVLPLLLMKITLLIRFDSFFVDMLDEVIAAPNQEDNGENVEKNVITRSLFSDFSKKSQDSDASECNSLMTSQDSNELQWFWGKMIEDDLCKWGNEY
ncbi:hypothetical protein HanHA300_Chr04g0150711 [Helianthus annuus]|nr:hypothetical protein HanHA300_Chr04g0150711 [Helianthus annuus]KAJ0590503.1 hypothetical protein HanIR_Chr04g0198151 [Helianthus annuus]KAJ0758906.1 hypothetical protein HanLR1_Chr04g0155571 [Helianthus annuus]KAJ0932780.1 hypothetical protein HanPSC8_Chr04g0177581 [Helianthus annuus]